MPARQQQRLRGPIALTPTRHLARSTRLRQRPRNMGELSRPVRKAKGRCCHVVRGCSAWGRGAQGGEAQKGRQPTQRCAVKPAPEAATRGRKTLFPGFLLSGPQSRPGGINTSSLGLLTGGCQENPCGFPHLRGFPPGSLGTAGRRYEHREV